MAKSFYINYGTERTPAKSKLCRKISVGSYLGTTWVADGPFWPTPSSDVAGNEKMKYSRLDFTGFYEMGKVIL